VSTVEPVTVTFEAVAAELLRAPLEEFVALRKEAAKDRPEVAKLAKPSQAAWSLNVYAHAKPRDLGSLLDCGAALREAQAAGDAARLRELTTAAHGQVRAIVDSIASGDAVKAQVEQTLRAAMSDSAAADAVQAGLLVKALAPAGFGDVDLAGSVAGSPPARPSRPVLRVVTTKQEEKVRRQAADAADAARAQLKESKRALAAAEAELVKRERQHTTSKRDRDRIGEALAAADSELREVAARLKKARRSKDLAEAEVAKARAAVASAEKQA
jgi:hypothetical protein